MKKISILYLCLIALSSCGTSEPRVADDDRDHYRHDDRDDRDRRDRDRYDRDDEDRDDRRHWWSW